MIDAGYVRSMARYNAWQNRQLTEGLKDTSDNELRTDRGAFFGSIIATLNHVLWGDTLWMSRFTSTCAAPAPDIVHTEFMPTFPVWSAERFRLDGAIRLWSESLNTIDLKGDLTWVSGGLQREMTTPLEDCIIGFFNHQTHHRGQVHAMMTAAGLTAPVTDFILMPEVD